LTAITETEVTVDSSEAVITIARAEITHAKRIPDRRARTASETLQEISSRGWPAPDQEYLGDWLLRAAGGWTNRGNSALAVGDPGVPLGTAIDAVRDWYAARDIRPGIMVPAPVGGRVGAELAGHDWSPQPPSLLQTAPLTPLAAAQPGVRLDAEPGEDWLALVAGRKGVLPAAARHLLTAVPQVRFARSDTDSGAPAAVARGVVGDGWLGLSLIDVLPEHRRRGLASAVIRALAHWAVGVGARRAYLQVEEHNGPALALYARLGFSTHHAYTTWNPG
jgi:GNAT superfamily N-acetyltransferase